MAQSSEASATSLMKAAGAGDQRAVDLMFPLVYDELRRLASVVRAGRAGETIGATALVHEAYLKLLRTDDLSWTDRAHFLAIAARAMRQVLVDVATRSAAEKRGGDQLDVSLSDAIANDQPLGPEELLDLNAAIDELAVENERAAKVLECRYFGGMSAEETAAVLCIALPTVTRDWRFARAWLTRRLSA
ncbi:MAG TPA: ECF-type sigma factor [Gemmatimonadaceae bacterium]